MSSRNFRLKFISLPQNNNDRMYYFGYLLPTFYSRYHPCINGDQRNSIKSTIVEWLFLSIKSPKFALQHHYRKKKLTEWKAIIQITVVWLTEGMTKRRKILSTRKEWIQRVKGMKCYNIIWVKGWKWLSSSAPLIPIFTHVSQPLKQLIMDITLT